MAYGGVIVMDNRQYASPSMRLCGNDDVNSIITLPFPLLSLYQSPFCMACFPPHYLSTLHLTIKEVFFRSVVIRPLTLNQVRS